MNSLEKSRSHHNINERYIHVFLVHIFIYLLHGNIIVMRTIAPSPATTHDIPSSSFCREIFTKTKEIISPLVN